LPTAGPNIILLTMYINTPRLTPCVKGLIIANVAIYIVQLIPGIGNFVTMVGALIPLNTFFGLQLWRLVTYMFLHSSYDIFHILFNMLSLYWFGVELEDIWGRRKFLIFYLVCGVGAGLFSLFNLIMIPTVPVVGASGAVLGLLTAYAFYYPERQLFFFGIFPLKVRTLVIGYAVLSIVFSIGNVGNIAHIVHLGGIAVGYAFLKVFKNYHLNVY